MRFFKKFLAGAVLLLLLAFPFVIYFNAQALTDWWQLRGYSPPAVVSSLTAQDSMTPYAQHVFFVNQPEIESNAVQFRDNCGETEKTIILGCYHSNQAGIFIYDINDPRLAGIQQVTSAHEMLHAAYDRLSSRDRDNVDNMLNSFLANGLKDQRVIDTINSYRQTEPKDVINEMHSIFGTEVANLPAPLEQYYKKYFFDRSVMTKYAATYEGEFKNREDQIKTYDEQLSSLKSEIDSLEQSLRSELTQINSDRARLDSLRASGRIGEYNAGVGTFNVEVNTYNANIIKLRTKITAYNDLIDKHNTIAAELASLNKAIDTRPTPQSIQ
ncbi:hypothetical protein KW794_00705 [Candidatus Saccharibacteria bacterium]|nr:hypothetical protein [Candidatus Saccharibacteria bacterium]